MTFDRDIAYAGSFTGSRKKIRLHIYYKFRMQPFRLFYMCVIDCESTATKRSYHY